MFTLSEFDIRYQPVKVVKGQALVDLIAERINTDIGILLVSSRGQHILFQSDYLPLAPTIWQNMKWYIRVWSCFLRPELKRWKFLGIQSW
jgi:hypothetical protein